MKKLLIFFLLLFLLAPAFGAVKKAAPKQKAAVITKTVAASPESAKVITFKDLSDKDPAYPFVMKMVVSYEALSGYPDRTFRGGKTITRAEFSKIMTKALAYLEKKYNLPLADESATAEVKFKDLGPKHWSRPFVAKLVAQYKILSGYPDGTFQPNKTINRFELAAILAKTHKVIYDRYEIAIPAATKEVALKDVLPKHWAMKDVQLMLSLKIMGAMKEKEQESPALLFKGSADVVRSAVAISGARLIGQSDAAIADLPNDRFEALRRKYRLAVAAPPAPSRIAKALEISPKPRATISSGWGNVYESASGTNNWLNFGGTATYGDIFSLWMLSGNYEIAGKYGFNQINYLVPAGGGGVSGGVVNENRYELELNTIYPVVDLWGVNGKLLLGAKYINLSNPTAPTNFTGFNAGLVTAAKAFGRNLLLRGFWSLPLARASVSPSALGQPAQLFDYEASIDYELLSYPVLFGLTGELMTFTGTGSRYYNMAFVRYYLF